MTVVEAVEMKQCKKRQIKEMKKKGLKILYLKLKQII